MLLEDIKDPAQRENLRKYMNALSASEGANYNTIVGKNNSFSDYSKHPNVVGLRTKDGNSTAAGRYQITKSTYDLMAKKLGITDFSPESQDKLAVGLMDSKGALPDILAGRFNEANNKLGGVWQSLPTGTSVNQGKRSQAFFDAALQHPTPGTFFSSTFDTVYDNPGTRTDPEGPGTMGPAVPAPIAAPRKEFDPFAPFSEERGGRTPKAPAVFHPGVSAPEQRLRDQAISNLAAEVGSAEVAPSVLRDVAQGDYLATAPKPAPWAPPNADTFVQNATRAQEDSINIREQQDKDDMHLGVRIGAAWYLSAGAMAVDAVSGMWNQEPDAPAVSTGERLDYLTKNPDQAPWADEILAASDNEFRNMKRKAASKQENNRIVGSHGVVGAIVPMIIGDPLALVASSGIGTGATVMRGSYAATKAAQVSTAAIDAVGAGVRAGIKNASIAEAASKAAVQGARAQAVVGTGAKVLTSVAENVAGNVAVLGAQAGFGDRISGMDVAMAAAVGTVLGVGVGITSGMTTNLFGRGPDGKIIDVVGTGDSVLDNAPGGALAPTRWDVANHEAQLELYTTAGKQLEDEADLAGDSTRAYTVQDLHERAKQIAFDRDAAVDDILLGGADADRAIITIEQREQLEANALDQVEEPNGALKSTAGTTVTDGTTSTVSSTVSSTVAPELHTKPFTVADAPGAKAVDAPGATVRPEINGTTVLSAKRVLVGLVETHGEDSWMGVMGRRLASLMGTEDIPVNLSSTDLWMTSKKKGAGFYDPNTDAVTLSPTHHQNPVTILHELTHAVTLKKIVSAGKPGASKVLTGAVKELDAIRKFVLKQLKDSGTVLKGTGDDQFKKYALTNVQELVAVVNSDKAVAEWMGKTPWAKGAQGTVKDKFINAVRNLLGMKEADTNALTRIMELTDDIANDVAVPTKPVKPEPVAHLTAAQKELKARKDMETAEVQKLIDETGMGTVADPAERALFAIMTDNAIKAVAKMGVDENRVRTFLTRLPEAVRRNFESSGILMLRSKNPQAQWTGGMLAESTTGAAGRGNTAAVDIHMMKNRINEKFLPEYHASFDIWLRENKISGFRAIVSDTPRERFDILVQKELSRRANTLEGDDMVPLAIRRAADANEEAYGTLLRWQKKVKVAGYEALPENSRGYQPRAMNAELLYNQVQKAPGLLRALQAETKRQMMDPKGPMAFDEAFAETASKKYWDHGLNKAMGITEIPAGTNAPGFAQQLREALRTVMSEDDIAKAMKSFTGGRANHTKGRLGLDITGKIIDPETKVPYDMAALYVSDQAKLMQRYTDQTTGYIALAQRGIYGEAGITAFLRSAAYGKNPATLDELDIMRMFFSEMTGRPYGNNGNPYLSGVRTYTALTSLGSMTVAQGLESLNPIGHMGVVSALKAVPGLRLMFDDVRTGKKNQLTESITAIGGKFDTPERWVMPGMDGSSTDAAGHMDVTKLSKMFRSYAKASTIMNGQRTMVTAQLRAVSEEVTRKSMNDINGANVMGKAMTDMGFTPEVIKGIKEDLVNIAKFDENGRIYSLDVRNTKNPRIMNMYITALHRGTRQMIQGKFLGETGKWVHDDMLSTMAQFRSFSVLASEKQLARQVANLGAPAVMVLLISQMMLTLPVYIAKLKLQSATMSDRDRKKFMDRRATPAALFAAVLSTTSLGGLSSDGLQIGMSTYGAFAEGREGANRTLLGNIPAVGRAEQVFSAVKGAAETKSLKSVGRVVQKATNLDSLLGVSSVLTEILKE